MCVYVCVRAGHFHLGVEGDQSSRGFAVGVQEIRDVCKPPEYEHKLNFPKLT